MYDTDYINHNRAARNTVLWMNTAFADDATLTGTVAYVVRQECY